MNFFQEFDTYLNNNFADDYWSDHGILHAQKLIQKFTKEDWQSLVFFWKKKPIKWQNFCAEILDFGDPHEATLVLADMLKSDREDLVVRAVDGLRNFDLKALKFSLDDNIIGKLQIIAAKGGLESIVIGEFLKNL